MVSERPLADYRYRCLPSYLFILDYVTTYYITIDVFVRALQNSLKPWKANPFWWANQLAPWETSGGHPSFRMSRFSGKVAAECGKQDNNKRTGNPPGQKGEGLEIISWRIISTAARPSTLVGELAALESMSIRHRMEVPWFWWHFRESKFKRCALEKKSANQGQDAKFANLAISTVLLQHGREQWR